MRFSCSGSGPICSAGASSSSLGLACASVSVASKVARAQGRHRRSGRRLSGPPPTCSLICRVEVNSNAGPSSCRRPLPLGSPPPRSQSGRGYPPSYRRGRRHGERRTRRGWTWTRPTSSAGVASGCAAKWAKRSRGFGFSSWGPRKFKMGLVHNFIFLTTWRSITLSLSLSPHRLRVLGRHAHSPLRYVQQAPVHVLEFVDLILEALLVG